MPIKIPFWGEKISINLPQKNIGEIVYPNRVDSEPERQVVLESLKNPVGAPTLDKFIKGEDRILFIVNDATRPTPTARILDLLWDKLKHKNIKFLIATGMHREPTPDEYREIFGERYPILKNQVYSHNAHDDDQNIHLGKTDQGSELYFNKLVVETKKIIYLTSVEPHYFAGYTGGAKSFLPGVAGYRTITHNHELALKFSARALEVENNPVRKDIAEAFVLVSQNKQIFGIQTVLDKDHRVYYCACGDTHKSFELACEKAKDVFSVEIKDKTDIVVAVAPYPMDIDLYQSQKAIDNAKLALNENGILILVSSCRKGVGDDTFVKLLSQSSNPDEALKKISKGYQFGFHKASKMAEIMKWASIWAFTRLNHNVLQNMFIQKYTSLQDAIDEALQNKGDERILFLMDASLTVPRVADRLLHKRRFIHGPMESEYDYRDVTLDNFFAD